jgi:hypothetical protein
MTETELQEIESRLPRGTSRLGANLDASQLATEVRGSWGEGAQLRQRLNDARDSGARIAIDLDAAREQAARYRAERDELVENCSVLRKTLAALLQRVPGESSGGPDHTDLIAEARRLTQASKG